VASVYLDSATNKLDFSGGPADLGTLTAGATRTFWLQLNDVNQNPMPAGSKVEVTSLVNATAGTILPATVPNVQLYSSATKDPSGASGYAQGSWHRFTITATNPGTCTAAANASFYVTVTTPGAGTASNATVTNIPFKLSVTCP
jgi:hypothetical protein